MFRRLLTLLVAVQIFVFGSLQVMAQEGINPPITQSQESTTESIQEDPEQSQSTNATVNQNQTTKTVDHDSVEQGQVVVEVISQEQTPNTDDQIEQTQTSNVTAVQGQIISNADELEAAQDQKASMNSSQSQQVSTSEENPKNQDQQTSVTTSQEQDLSIDGNTSIAGQVQYTNIETKQQSELNNEENGDDLGLETKVELNQETGLITSGTGTINQTQSAEASGEINSSGDEPAFSLIVFVKNGLEILKRGTETFIKVIQRIDINDDTIEIVEKEYLLDDSPTGQVQEYSNLYDWGTLYILNKAVASILGDGDVEAFMESIISFDFILGKPIKEGINNEEEDNETGNENEEGNGNNNGEDNGTGNEDNNGTNNEEENGNSNEEDNANNNEENIGNDEDIANSNEEYNDNTNEDDNGYTYVKNDRYNNKVNFLNYLKNKKDSTIWELDSDNDGIADFLEIFKFNTDPFNSDTDGDGLTDLYEVAYHDLSIKQNFQVIHLSKQERFQYLLQMNYSPKDLNPLMKDKN